MQKGEWKRWRLRCAFHADSYSRKSTLVSQLVSWGKVEVRWSWVDQLPIQGARRLDRNHCIGGVSLSAAGLSWTLEPKG